MQTTTPKLKTATVRPSRVIAPVVTELLLAGVGSWLYHPVMVKLHGGTWCMRADPDGRSEFLYGGACSR